MTRQVSLSALQAITKHNIMKTLEKLNLTKKEYNDILTMAMDIINASTIDEIKQKGIVKQIIYGGMPKRGREDGNDKEDDDKEDDEEENEKNGKENVINKKVHGFRAEKIIEPKGKQQPDDRKTIRKRLTTQVEELPRYQKPERKNYYLFTKTTPDKRELITGQQINPNMQRPQQTDDDIQHELYKAKQRVTKEQQREQTLRRTLLAAQERTPYMNQVRRQEIEKTAQETQRAKELADRDHAENMAMERLQQIKDRKNIPSNTERAILQKR